MKFYIVEMGQNFEDAIEGHQGNFYPSVEDAKLWARITLYPNQRYMVCDENGGVHLIGRISPLAGEA